MKLGGARRIADIPQTNGQATSDTYKCTIEDDIIQIINEKDNLVITNDDN